MRETSGATLLGDLEPLAAAEHDCLQHLVRTDVRLEVTRVPQLAEKFSETLSEQHHLIAVRTSDGVVVLGAQEVVAQRCNVG